VHSALNCPYPIHVAHGIALVIVVA